MFLKSYWKLSFPTLITPLFSHHGSRSRWLFGLLFRWLFRWLLVDTIRMIEIRFDKYNVYRSKSMRQSVQLTMRPKAELLIDTIDALSEANINIIYPWSRRPCQPQTHNFICDYTWEWINVFLSTLEDIIMLYKS